MEPLRIIAFNIRVTAYYPLSYRYDRLMKCKQCLIKMITYSIPNVTKYIVGYDDCVVYRKHDL